MRASRDRVDSLSLLSAAKLAELDTTIVLRHDPGVCGGRGRCAHRSRPKLHARRPEDHGGTQGRGAGAAGRAGPAAGGERDHHIHRDRRRQPGGVRARCADHAGDPCGRRAAGAGPSADRGAVGATAGPGDGTGSAASRARGTDGRSSVLERRSAGRQRACGACAPGPSHRTRAGAAEQRRAGPVRVRRLPRPQGAAPWHRESRDVARRGSGGRDHPGRPASTWCCFAGGCSGWRH